MERRRVFGEQVIYRGDIRNLNDEYRGRMHHLFRSHQLPDSIIRSSAHAACSRTRSSGSSSSDCNWATGTGASAFPIEVQQFAHTVRCGSSRTAVNCSCWARTASGFTSPARSNVSEAFTFVSSSSAVSAAASSGGNSMIASGFNYAMSPKMPAVFARTGALSLVRSSPSDAVISPAALG